eukprot:TRINITY_DN50687_c0_g1_i1.p1 TRINITY_DN50687_c0_g1~~TRINITY_DN50687_c0_g1_i1.p1  ORF type:complete len:368 (+),score=129.60 TRINITY_DN50687_c0_g1_i1:84-1106(+)
MAGEPEYIWKEYQFPSGAVYRGSFLGTRKEGRGFWRHPEGETYEGGYHDNKQHGWGTYKFGESGKQYRGEWNAGEMHGRGMYIFNADESEMYIGRYEHDKKHGKGLYRYADGRCTFQEWAAGDLRSETEADPMLQLEYFCEKIDIVAECDKVCRNRLLPDSDSSDAAVEKQFQIRLEQKEHTFPSGAHYRGEFLGSKKHGRGLWKHPEGDLYDGQFRYNKHSGWGVYVIGKSGKKFVGGWSDGKMDGWGVYCFNPDETEYFVGTYKDDQKHGTGVYYFASGGLKYQTWERGDLKSEVDCDEATHKKYDEVRRTVLRKVQQCAVEYRPAEKQMQERPFTQV